MTDRNVAFVGPGIMGQPMARNLMRAGYALWVYGRRAASTMPLAAEGAVVCNSPREAAVHADLIVTMVSDTSDVEEVILGEQGIVHGARAGALVIDMSTISPTATRKIAEVLAANGIEMLDAPVSGGEVGAIDGTLSIMVGGKAQAFQRAKPLLEAMGKNIVHVGDHGAGQVTKACNQIVVALTIQGVAEALTFARKNGVDPARVREALLGGFAGSRILEVHGQRMLDHDFKPGFKTRLHQKDLHIVMQTARELGLALPGTAQVMQHMNALMGSGEGELDSAAVVEVIERLSGFSSKGHGGEPA